MQRYRFAAVVVCGLAGWAAERLLAEDWPQWRGIDRAAVWTESGIVDRFGAVPVSWTG